jgi:MYXO-CTERM domain-containing protein
MFVNGEAWNSSISPDGKTATFTAPSGKSLMPGDLFFAQAAFTGALSSNGVAFNGAFDPPSPAPEPASLTLAGIGAAALLGYGWRQRRRAAA